MIINIIIYIHNIETIYLAINIMFPMENYDSHVCKLYYVILLYFTVKHCSIPLYTTAYHFILLYTFIIGIIMEHYYTFCLVLDLIIIIRCKCYWVSAFLVVPPFDHTPVLSDPAPVLSDPGNGQHTRGYLR